MRTRLRPAFLRSKVRVRSLISYLFPVTRLNRPISAYFSGESSLRASVIKCWSDWYKALLNNRLQENWLHQLYLAPKWRASAFPRGT